MTAEIMLKKQKKTCFCRFIILFYAISNIETRIDMNWPKVLTFIIYCQVCNPLFWHKDELSERNDNLMDSTT